MNKPIKSHMNTWTISSRLYRLKTAVRAATLVTRTNIRLCGCLQATYMETIGTSNRKGASDMNVTHRMFQVIGLILGLALGSESFAQNAIADWHAVMESTVASAGRKNVVALPYFAYVDVAMYDAINSIDDRFRPFAVSVHAPRGASKDAAAASAAHAVLAHYFPTKAATFDAALATSLAAIADSQRKTDGINVGKAVAAQWLALRAGDGLEAAIVYPPGHAPGIWEPVPTYPAPPPNTPPAPVGVWMTQFKPFAMRSADQFLADVHPPLALTSQAWARGVHPP